MFACTGVILTDGLKAWAVRAAIFQRQVVRDCLIHNEGHTYLRFRLLNVLLPEEELSIEVRQVDRVEVKKRDVSEPTQYYVLHYRIIQHCLNENTLED